MRRSSSSSTTQRDRGEPRRRDRSRIRRWSVPGRRWSRIPRSILCGSAARLKAPCTPIRWLRALDGSYAHCVPCDRGILTGQAQLPPRLRYLSLDIQADDTADFSLDNSYSLEDTFSWFIPNKLGRHDVKFGAKYTHIWISNPDNSEANGTYTLRPQPGVQSRRPANVPERLNIRVPGIRDYELNSHIWELYAQDKWQVRSGLTLSLGVRYDLEVMPIRRRGESPVRRSRASIRSTRTTSRRGWGWSGIRTARAGRSFVPAMGCSTTEPCWGRLTTSSLRPNTRSRSSPTSLRTLPTPVLQGGSFRPIPR